MLVCQPAMPKGKTKNIINKKVAQAKRDGTIYGFMKLWEFAQAYGGAADGGRAANGADEAANGAATLHGDAWLPSVFSTAAVAVLAHRVRQ